MTLIMSVVSRSSVADQINFCKNSCILMKLSGTKNTVFHKIITVRLGKMAQHARHWALFMAKLKGQSQKASNMALGKCIGLQHVQISAS